MKYDIFVSGEIEGTTRNTFGIEFQPPIGSAALEGAMAMLSRSDKDTWSTDREFVIDASRVTRDDAEGTAAVIETNYFRGDSGVDIARKLGKLIDPADRHEIEVHPPQ